MRILIHTVGTRGDVQPYVALGKGLIARGHEVTICTCAEFEPFVTRHGLGYAFMNNDLLDFLRSEDGKIAMESSSGLWEMARTAFRLLPKMGDMMRRQLQDAWESTRTVDPDLILFHPKSLGGKDFSDKLGVPSALAFYVPMYVATGDFPAMGFPRLRIGKWYNHMTYWLIDLATRLGTGRYMKEWRKANGLARSRGRYLRRSDGSSIPALHAFSESVIPRPKDWPDTSAITGYWFLDSDEDYQPPPELDKFLEAGEPPIYIGFGSIFGRDPKRLTHTIVEAVKRSGQRAILAVGWGGLDLSELRLPPSIFAIDSIPHDWLFPRVAAVVHHGGCGTTAAGLRAGKPTIICPFFGDQPFWGALVMGLGVGSKPIPQRHLTADKLADAIRLVISDLGMREKAEKLGDAIRRESGVTNAVEFVENIDCDLD